MQYRLIIGLILWALSLLVQPADAGERFNWYIQQGKGRPLCESLVRIANDNAATISPDTPWHLIEMTPNIPWKQVMSLKGVREPEWTELDPMQYEEFFLKARDIIAIYNDKSEVITFTRWFLPPRERWAEESVRKKPMLDEETLKIYRDFARRGGKLKVLFRPDISETGNVYMLRDFVQYETHESDSSDWDGYSLKVGPGLSAIHETGYPIISIGGSIFRGRGFLITGYRILMYKNNVFSFIRDYGEYRVNQLSGERNDINDENSPYYNETHFCKINSKSLKRRNKK